MFIVWAQVGCQGICNAGSLANFSGPATDEEFIKWAEQHGYTYNPEASNLYGLVYCRGKCEGIALVGRTDNAEAAKFAAECLTNLTRVD